MNIFIEIIWVILLGFTAMFYLTFDIWREKKSGTEKVRKVWKEQKNILIFCSIGIACAVGLSLDFSFLYKENLLITNLKLITLVMLLFPAGWVDFKKYIIPNELILFGLIIRAILLIIEMVVYSDTFFSVVKDILYALAIVLFFLLIGVFLVKKGIGMGDIKLLFIMAIYQGISGMCGSIFFSLLVAFVVSVFLLITHKKTKKDTIPFAPAVLLGTLISVALSGM